MQLNFKKAECRTTGSVAGYPPGTGDTIEALEGSNLGRKIEPDNDTSFDGIWQGHLTRCQLDAQTRSYLKHLLGT